MGRIIVRHSESEDAQTLHKLYSHPAVSKWQARSSDLPAGYTSLVACIDDRVVGQLTLMVEQNARRSRVATFGIGVDAHYQGQGIASVLMTEMLELCVDCSPP